MSQSNPQTGSVEQPNKNGNGSTRLIRIMLVLFGAMTLVAIPVLGYFIGDFIGIHMSENDVIQGYAYGGLLYTIYNTTHNPIYGIEAQQVQSIGVTIAQGDITTLSMIGLIIGLSLDPFVAYMIVKEYEKLDNE
jgi:hypothetical protein